MAILELKLDDNTYASLQQLATSRNTTAEEVVKHAIGQLGLGTNGPGPQPSDAEIAAADARLDSHTIAIDDPAGSDNQAIDADLIRAYADE